MSIVVKRTGTKEYAYIAYRQGRKVVHKYLGPLADPRVSRRVAGMEAIESVPMQFRHLFWDSDPANMNIRKNARYVIERVLELGNLEAVRWIQKVFSTRLIMEHGEGSRKISQKSKNFWRIWFDEVDPS